MPQRCPRDRRATLNAAAPLSLLCRQRRHYAITPLTLRRPLFIPVSIYHYAYADVLEC